MPRLVILALCAGLVACDGDLHQSAEPKPPNHADDAGDPANPGAERELPDDDCVVEISGRCFNYDPREHMGKSAYASGSEKQNEPEVISARVAMGKHRRSSWKREIRYTGNPALALARISVSEEGFHSSARARGALWQVVNNVRAHHCDNRRLDHVDPLRRISQCRTADGDLVDVASDQSVDRARETRLSAMRRLSPHVTGVLDPKRDRQRWTSTLRDSDEAPAAWVQCVAEDRPAGCHGDWRLYEDRWREVRSWAAKVVTGRLGAPNPCPAPVIAWGGVMDDAIAKARGLERVDCGLDDARNNRFWAKPRGDAS